MRNKIRKVLREALGVPKNLTQTASIIYKEVIDELSKENFDENDKTEKIEFELDGVYPVSDLTIKTINITIDVTYHPQADEVLFLSMAVGHKAKADPILPKIHSQPSDEVPLLFDFVAPEDGNINQVINFILNNQRELTSSISHELKHVYDYYKKRTESFRQRSDYRTYSGMKFGIPPLDEFMHFLYFTTAVENLVRPSEIAYLIQHDKVKRKDFLNFLEENNKYKTLKRIRNFSYQKLKEELKSYEQTIDNVFEQVGETPPSDLDEKIERFLDIFLITLNDARLQNLAQLTFEPSFDSLFASIFGGSKQNENEKEKYFNRIEREIKKFENSKEFFEFEEKKFKFVSEKVLKKIYKLYDMTTVNESIVDWEMYHKYKTKKTPFTNEIKYDSKKMFEEKLKNQKNKK